MNKPRIVYVKSMPGYCFPMWRCSGGGMSGIGGNPAAAYESWLWESQDMLNIYSHSTGNQPPTPRRTSSISQALADAVSWMGVGHNRGCA